MSLNVLIPPHAHRIYCLHDPHKVVKLRINLPKFQRGERVGFSPVRATSMPNGDGFEIREKSTVRDRKAVRPSKNKIRRMFQFFPDPKKTNKSTIKEPNLYCTMPIQQVDLPKQGLSHISSSAENRISIGKCGRRPLGFLNSFWR